MRLLFCVLLCGVFAPLAHADEWFDYIQVQCEPDKKIFEARDVRVQSLQVDGKSVPNKNSIETSGELFLKRDKISWAETSNGDVRMAKDLGLNIPTCIIEDSQMVGKFEHKGRTSTSGFLIEETQSIEFKVARTKIDQGNVQRQCGAASGAEFTVYVNDVPLGVFPSAKDLCFNPVVGSSAVSYSPRGLRHCEYADRLSTGVIDSGSFKTDVTVCHEGTASSYLKFVSTMNTEISDEVAEDVAVAMKDELFRFNLRDFYTNAREGSYEIYLEKKKNAELTLALEVSQKETEALEAELEKARNKSFSAKLFQKDE